MKEQGGGWGEEYVSKQMLLALRLARYSSCSVHVCTCFWLVLVCCFSGCILRDVMFIPEMGLVSLLVMVNTLSCSGSLGTLLDEVLTLALST